MFKISKTPELKSYYFGNFFEEEKKKETEKEFEESESISSIFLEKIGKKIENNEMSETPENSEDKEKDYKTQKIDSREEIISIENEKEKIRERINKFKKARELLKNEMKENYSDLSLLNELETNFKKKLNHYHTTEKKIFFFQIKSNDPYKNLIGNKYIQNEFIKKANELEIKDFIITDFIVDENFVQVKTNKEIHLKWKKAIAYATQENMKTEVEVKQLTLSQYVKNKKLNKYVK